MPAVYEKSPCHWCVSVYGPRELRGIAPTYIDSRALFIEDSLAVTSRLPGRRRLALRGHGPRARQPERGARGGGRGFERAFRWWSWRAGAVVNLHDDVVAAAWTTFMPDGSLVRATAESCGTRCWQVVDDVPMEPGSMPETMA